LWLLRRVATYAKWLVMLAIFSFRFLEWWFSADNKGLPARRLPVPPPPSPPLRAAAAPPRPASHRLCALCGAERVNPTACPSGFVFCFACVHPYVAEHARCPVTLQPCDVGQLRRIFES
jgi:hypothetical protein